MVTRAMWLRQSAGAYIHDLLPHNVATAIPQLRQYAGYGKMPATAKCQLWQNACVKLHNFPVPQLLEAAHDKSTICLNMCAMARCLEEAPNNWWHDAWILHLMAARCLDVAPNGWWPNAWILRLMVVQCLILHLMAGRCYILCLMANGAMPFF